MARNLVYGSVISASSFSELCVAHDWPLVERGVRGVVE